MYICDDDEFDLRIALNFTESLVDREKKKKNLSGYASALFCPLSCSVLCKSYYGIEIKFYYRNHRSVCVCVCVCARALSPRVHVRLCVRARVCVSLCLFFSLCYNVEGERDMHACVYVCINVCARARTCVCLRARACTCIVCERNSTTSN